MNKAQTSRRDIADGNKWASMRKVSFNITKWNRIQSSNQFVLFYFPTFRYYTTTCVRLILSTVRQDRKLLLKSILFAIRGDTLTSNSKSGATPHVNIGWQQFINFNYHTLCHYWSQTSMSQLDQSWTSHDAQETRLWVCPELMFIRKWRSIKYGHSQCQASSLYIQPSSRTCDRAQITQCKDV